MVTSVFNLSDLDGINGFTVHGISTGDNLGRGAAGAGDVNGDSINDIIIGAPGADPSGRQGAGQIYLIFGRQGGFSDALDLRTLDNQGGVVMNGTIAGDRSGYSVAGAGDPNDDGVDDIIIGAPGAGPGGRQSAGKTYLIFGRRGVWPGFIDLSSLDGSNGLIIEGVDAHDQSGSSVAPAGDLNGDRIDDVVIGAWNADGSGTSYVVFGHAGPWPASLSLASLNGSNGVVMPGINRQDSSGSVVAPMQDFDGDRVDDLFISSPGAYSGRGECYVVFGHTGPWSSPLELSSLNGVNGIKIVQGSSFDHYGSSAGSAHDVNGDNKSDLILGAWAADPHERNAAGQSRLIFGHSGPWSSASWSSAQNGSQSVYINGAEPFDSSGIAVALTEDLNGDHLDDIVIGASGATVGNRNRAGKVYVLFGRRSDWPDTIELSSLGTNGVEIHGAGSYDGIGTLVTSIRDVSGDGIGELIIASHREKVGNQTDAGKVYVVFGGHGVFDRLNLEEQTTLTPGSAETTAPSAPTEQPSQSPSSSRPSIAPVSTPSRHISVYTTMSSSSTFFDAPHASSIDAPTASPDCFSSLDAGGSTHAPSFSHGGFDNIDGSKGLDGIDSSLGWAIGGSIVGAIALLIAYLACQRRSASHPLDSTELSSDADDEHSGSNEQFSAKTFLQLTKI